MKKHKLEELVTLYTEADSADASLFAEQRSNLLLVAGDHYAKKNSRYWSQIRDSKNLSNDQKLRLTRNHIHKICKTLVNNIISYAPGVTVSPKNQKEPQHQKVAEMNQSVWMDLKERNSLHQKVRQWCEDFIQIGECAAKIFWDPNAGKFLGYEQATDELGQLLVDEQMQPVASETPIFAGDIVFERLFGFNVLRDPSAKSFDESSVVMTRKMVPISELKKKYEGNEEALKAVQEGSDETYVVMDGSKNNYSTSKGQAMWIEWFFRPCYEYPNGYYYMGTKYGVVHEGELPFGIFPIVYAGYDEIATTPRARAIIKQLRPYQGEINRCASKVAEHQVTVGDDKMLVQDGAKLRHGDTLSGIRTVRFTGANPIVVPGRAGDQYIPHIESNISEMYNIANVVEDSQEIPAQADPYTMLFTSIRNKKKFVLYAEKFEHFLKQICKVSLYLAKYYYDENHLIPVVGKDEYLNVAEFKSSTDLCYQIVLEPQSEDFETKIGRLLTFNHILQYVGNNLSKEDLGRLFRIMPYVNEEAAFEDLTLDYDNVVSDILAMDRGIYRPATESDNHEYYIKKLENRMKKQDFDLLAPEIKQMYAQKKQEHMQIQAEQLKEVQMAQAGFIPTGGYAVTVQMYVTDPNDTGKTRLARVPYEAMQWLLEKLQQQGVSQAMLSGYTQGTQAEFSRMIPQNGGGVPMEAVPSPQ